MALGGSTNAIIHWSRWRGAPASPLTLERFDEMSARGAGDRQRPAVRRQYLMEDFFYAGGLRALMAQISASGSICPA